MEAIKYDGIVVYPNCRGEAMNQSLSIELSLGNRSNIQRVSLKELGSYMITLYNQQEVHAVSWRLRFSEQEERMLSADQLAEKLERLWKGQSIGAPTRRKLFSAKSSTSNDVLMHDVKPWSLFTEEAELIG